MTLEHLEEEIPTGTPETGHSEKEKEDEAKAKRHAEIMAGKEKQAAEAEKRRLVAETAIDVLSDHTMLIDMDPEMGKEVVKYLHKKGQATTDDYDTLVNTLRWKGEKKETKEIDVERLVEEKLRKREEESLARETDRIVEEWLSKAPEGLREEMEKEYRDIADDRKLKPEKAKKVIEKIDAFYRKKELEEERNDSAYANMGAYWVRKSEAAPSKKASAKTLASFRALGYSDKDLKELWYI